MMSDIAETAIVLVAVIGGLSATMTALLVAVHHIERRRRHDDRH